MTSVLILRILTLWLELSLEPALAVPELISFHFSLSQVVRDSDLFRLLGALVFVDVLLLVIWMILHPPSRQVISHSDGAQPVCSQKRRSIENIELVVFRKSKERRFSGKCSGSRNLLKELKPADILVTWPSLHKM